MKNIRSATLSGTWYEADPLILAASIDQFLEGADPSQLPSGRPWMAVAPHAGHSYCGPVAGRLFGLLKNACPKNIIILAPNHRMVLNEIALPDVDAFETPLGQVPLNLELVQKLALQPGFSINNEAHAEEHAIEILLPFLQRTWPHQHPPIVPLLVPMDNPANLKQAGRILQNKLGDQDLLLVSSDFTHYGASFGFVPFDDNIAENVERLDAGAILKILGGDAEGLLKYGRETGITMCGLAACCVAMADGPPTGYEAALLDYGRSGDRDRNYEMSVSYASLLLTQGNEVS